MVLDTKESATAGIDRATLISNTQAEVDKFSTQLGVKAVPAHQKPAPAGAQGDASVTEWVMKIATDPAMVKAYVQARERVTSIFYARHQGTTTSFMNALSLSKSAPRMSRS
ncbi:hypothetical protein [Bradyrhizobium sp. USDA 4501]